jgi:hypothetical protein
MTWACHWRRGGRRGRVLTGRRVSNSIVWRHVRALVFGGAAWWLWCWDVAGGVCETFDVRGKVGLRNELSSTNFFYVHERPAFHRRRLQMKMCLSHPGRYMPVVASARTLSFQLTPAQMPAMPFELQDQKQDAYISQYRYLDRASGPFTSAT